MHSSEHDAIFTDCVLSLRVCFFARNEVSGTTGAFYNSLSLPPPPRAAPPPETRHSSRLAHLVPTSYPCSLFGPCLVAGLPHHYHRPNRTGMCPHHRRSRGDGNAGVHLDGRYIARGTFIVSRLFVVYRIRDIQQQGGGEVPKHPNGNGKTAMLPIQGKPYPAPVRAFHQHHQQLMRRYQFVRGNDRNDISAGGSQGMAQLAVRLPVSHRS